MKKTVLLASLLTTSLLVGVQTTYAEVKSEAKSKSSVKTVVGDNTAPVDPLDPTNFR
ncbi:hypothetical protein AAH972_12600 [Enterococcus faecalis]|uniref:hypothetical protein n=1 Tax=Enterococcus faecalis TaxID=1351 RepID=UPI0031CDA4DC